MPFLIIYFITKIFILNPIRLQGSSYGFCFFWRSSFLEHFRIFESYHGLSLGLITTPLCGIVAFTKSINLFVNNAQLSFTVPSKRHS